MDKDKGKFEEKKYKGKLERDKDKFEKDKGKLDKVKDNDERHQKNYPQFLREEIQRVERGLSVAFWWKRPLGKYSWQEEIQIQKEIIVNVFNFGDIKCIPKANEQQNSFGIWKQCR